MQQICVDEPIFPNDILQDIRTIHAILREYGAMKIILYGSLARGDYRVDSDIDICVEGIPSQRYFRAIAECIMQSTRPVSILDLQNVTGYLRERILDEGVLLYEQGRSTKRDRIRVG